MSAVAKIDQPEHAVIAAITPMEMLNIAVQQGADIDKMKQLMELSERWEANQARKAFEAAISEAKAEIKPILKNRTVNFEARNGGSRTNYMYEDLAQIAGHVDPILSKHGLSYRHRSKQDGKKLSITCILTHRDGHSEETTLTADNDESGNKNSIQGIGSAATFLQRYTLKLALGLAASKDDDGRGTGSKNIISDSQLADLEAKISEVGANRAQFLKFLKVESLTQLPTGKYNAAIQALNDKAMGVK